MLAHICVAWIKTVWSVWSKRFQFVSKWSVANSQFCLHKSIRSHQQEAFVWNGTYEDFMPILTCLIDLCLPPYLWSKPYLVAWANLWELQGTQLNNTHTWTINLANAYRKKICRPWRIFSRPPPHWFCEGEGPAIKEKKKFRRPLNSREGGKTLMTRPLKKELFFAASLSRRFDFLRFICTFKTFLSSAENTWTYRPY